MTTLADDTRAMTLQGVKGGLQGPRYALVAYHRDGTEVAPLSPGKRVVVGRVPPADLVVDDTSLSRQHARFCLVEDEVLVEDLGSTNGTWVGGENVPSAALRAGDVIVLGGVTCAIQAVGGRPQIGLDGHDRFAAQLEKELIRARHFDRPFSVVMFRVHEQSQKIHEWAPRIAEGLRPIDNVALYGGDTLEALLPECSASEALGLVRKIAEQLDRVPLRSGVSAYPDAATTSEGLIATCREALQRTSDGRRTAVAPSAMVRGGEDADSPFVAQSAVMGELLDMARRIAKGVIPVLVHGETGTGKEVLARFLHQSSPRAAGPLVAVNCAAIPGSLVESTLFGHVKGAFTGANQAHAGVFEAAEGGTVLLDEIGELPAAAQAALLRVLENKVVTRVGSTSETPVDVRILAASHRNLEAMVDDGAFRQDLLYRLNAVTLELPALRDRKEDIVPLAEHFLREANRRNGTNVRAISDGAVAALRNHDWPGNVRELRNAIERAVVIAEHDQLELVDLPRRVQHKSKSEAPPRLAEPTDAPPAGGPRVRRAGESFRDCVERIEAQMLRNALEDAGGNQSEAARLLDMPRRTLVHKIKAYGLRDS